MKKEFNYNFYDLNIKNDVLKNKIEEFKKAYDSLENEIYFSYFEWKINYEEFKKMLEILRKNKI